MLKQSYRGAEAFLIDCPDWLKDIGMERVPDHNTLCRAANYLLRTFRANTLLDVLSGWAAEARMLKLSQKPLAVDSTSYESHHVSRYYEQRCRKTRLRMKAKDGEKGRKSSRSRTVRQLPKLGIGVATSCHLVLSMWTGTGMGADQPHFEPVVFDAWRRSMIRRFKVPPCDDQLRVRFGRATRSGSAIGTRRIGFVVMLTRACAFEVAAARRSVAGWPKCYRARDALRL